VLLREPSDYTTREAPGEVVDALGARACGRGSVDVEAAGLVDHETRTGGPEPSSLSI
jgi:hypothetical protein